MIVLWILLGLIALIFLLLCIPVRFDLNYNGEATVFKIPRASRTGEKTGAEKREETERKKV